MNNSGPRTQAGRQEGLEARLLGFLGHHAHLGVGEAGFLDPIMEFVLFETQPAVGIQFAGFLEAVGA